MGPPGAVPDGGPGGPPGGPGGPGGIPQELFALPDLKTLGAPDPNRPTDPAKQISYDLLAYVKLLNSGAIFPGGSNYVSGGRVGYFGAQRWAIGITRMRNAGQLQITNISVDNLDGNTAKVTISDQIHITAPEVPDEIRNALGKDTQEQLTLKNGPDYFHPGSTIWQIVPPDAEPKMDPAQGPLDIIGFTTYHLAQLVPQYDPNAATVTQTHLKVLALGVAQFLEQWNQNFAFDNQNSFDALLPFIKDPAAFAIPNSFEHYSFNDGLSNHSAKEIQTPANTVLFYEGRDGNLSYSYDGKAAVGFADGHVALLSPDDAKTLIWQLKAPNG